jgi:Glycosyltransferase Family 4
MRFEQVLDAASGTACLPAIRDDLNKRGAEANWDADRWAASSGTLESAGRPLRVMFVQTDMRVGGAEMITANVIRRLNRLRFAPELCCLKERGALGESLGDELPVHHGLLAGKYDLRVWPRLTGLLRRRKIDAVITVGAGDKMFWGRLAARRVGVPVILSALHSTGWPDGVGRLNQMLTPITDSFIAVAESHGRFLASNLKISEERGAKVILAEGLIVAQ